MAIVWHSINSNLKIGVDWGSSATDTSARITPKVYRYDSYNTDNYGGTYSESLSPDPVGSGSWGPYGFGSGSGERLLDTFSARTYERGHTAKTVKLKVSWSNIGSWYSGSFHSLGSGSHEFSLPIPARPSYAVRYDANGGSGAPTSQTKWYGENLALSSGKPTRSLYNFKGWATSRGGNVQYAPGETYTGNAALTLYAVWEIAYKPPTITGVSAYRCDASGTSADEGTYAYVSFRWAVDTSATPGNAAAEVKIGIRAKGSTGSYAYGTVRGTTTGTSGTAYAILGGSLSVDSQHEVVVSIKDTTSYANNTVSATGVITKAFFTMDFYRGGRGIAFGTAATAEGFECAMPATFTGGFKIGSTSLTEEQLKKLIALI